MLVHTQRAQMFLSYLQQLDPSLFAMEITLTSDTETGQLKGCMLGHLAVRFPDMMQKHPSFAGVDPEIAVYRPHVIDFFATAQHLLGITQQEARYINKGGFSLNWLPEVTLSEAIDFLSWWIANPHQSVHAYEPTGDVSLLYF